MTSFEKVNKVWCEGVEVSHMESVFVRTGHGLQCAR